MNRLVFVCDRVACGCARKKKAKQVTEATGRQRTVTTMAMMMQRLIQNARSFLFPETTFATSLLAPTLLQGAAAAPASAANPLNEALWLAAPKSKVSHAAAAYE